MLSHFFFVVLFDSAYSIKTIKLEWSMNDKLQKIWKDTVMAQLWYCPDICLAGLKKTMKASGRIASVASQIQTEHLQNISRALPLD
jgi:hypothetical protein